MAKRLLDTQNFKGGIEEVKKSFKITALLLALVLSLSMLAACGGTADTESQIPETQSPEVQESGTQPVESEDPAGETEPVEEVPEGPDFENYTIITTSDIAGQDVEFRVLPDGYNTYETEHAMTSVVIHYTTDVYGETYEKMARVYLPYGYDPEDTGTKYNVIYFQHGNQGAPNVLEHDLKSLHALNLLNNIFDPDHQVMEPCIIVCPTYYLVYDETSYVTPADNPAGDGRYEGIDALYHLEVLQDLIPAVESQFNVYCTDFSEEGIKASRDHRAWAGYSRGSMCTYYMFHENFEYFAYWMPMSAPLTLDGGVAGETSLEDAFNYLKAPIEANPDLDFFIYATAGGDGDKSGTKELALDMQEQMKYFAAQTDIFSFGNDPEVNNLYFTRSEFLHNDLYFPYSLANAADVLFK